LRQDMHERDVALAWHVALFSRQPTLPALPSVLANISGAAPRPQTPEQMRAQLGVVAELYGLALRSGVRES